MLLSTDEIEKYQKNQVCLPNQGLQGQSQQKEINCLVMTKTEDGNQLIQNPESTENANTRLRADSNVSNLRAG